MRHLMASLGRAVGGAARSLLGGTVTGRTRVPGPAAAVRTVRERVRAASLLPVHVPGAGGPAPHQELLDVLGPWGLRGAVRTAVELYDTYGDPDDVLSSTQVDQLRLAKAHFADLDD